MSKLLVFNEDYGDEHNVPALTVMTDKEYEIWLKSPSGELNPNFEEENKIFLKKLADYDKYCKEAARKGLGNKPVNQYTEEDRLWFTENEETYVNSYNTPKKVDSYLVAYLGNNGEYFEQNYEHLYLMEEFVDAGLVIVTDVSDSFVEIFNKAKLSNLSLCNIFEIEEFDNLHTRIINGF